MFGRTLARFVATASASLPEFDVLEVPFARKWAHMYMAFVISSRHGLINEKVVIRKLAQLRHYIVQPRKW